MSRAFHLGDILSVTGDKLVAPRGMQGIYDLCGYLTRQSLHTHQLVHAQSNTTRHLKDRT